MTIYNDILQAILKGEKLLAILIDPDKFPRDQGSQDVEEVYTAFAKAYLEKIPSQTTHILVGGSTDSDHKTEKVVLALKKHTSLPIVLFPGNYNQITPAAHAILYLTLLSGRNAEYLIGQQIKGALATKKSGLEVIPTGYVLVNGGVVTAVQKVSKTLPMNQSCIDDIVATALAGQFSGKQCIYLEAGSGAKTPVNATIINAVKEATTIPLIVGGGIRSQATVNACYDAGADLVVIGTAFEDDVWE